MSNNLALNPFKKGKKAEVEQVRKVEVELCSDLEKAIERYHDFCQIDNMKVFHMIHKRTYDVPTLTPSKITDFFSYIIKADLVKGLIDGAGVDVFSGYTTLLIEASYKAGNNDFYIHTYDNELNSLFCSTKGKKHNPLNVTVYGDVGDFFACECEYGNYTLFGNSKSHFAHYALGSNFTVYGKVRDCYARYLGKNTAIKILDSNGELLEEITK